MATFVGLGKSVCNVDLPTVLLLVRKASMRPTERCRLRAFRGVSTKSPSKRRFSVDTPHSLKQTGTQSMQELITALTGLPWCPFKSLGIYIYLTAFVLGISSCTFQEQIILHPHPNCALAEIKGCRKYTSTTAQTHSNY
jgi:hypothetical protein